MTRLAPAAKRKPKKNDISWGRRGGCALFRTLATNDRLTDTSLRVLSSAKKMQAAVALFVPRKKGIRPTATRAGGPGGGEAFVW